MRKAAELIDCLDLESIHPRDLSSYVASSGLVSTEKLCETYRQLAMSSAESGFRCKRRRVFHYWDAYNEMECVRIPPGDYGSRFLDCEPFQRNNWYKWTMKVESIGNLLYLGVGKGSRACHCPWLFCSDGSFVGPNLSHPPGSLPGFRTGSTVQFTWDTSTEGNLSVSVNGRDAIILQSSRRLYSAALDVDECVPKFFCDNSLGQIESKVRFCGFD